MNHLVNTIYKELSEQQFDAVREMFTNSILFPKSADRTDALHRLGAELFKQNNPNGHNQECLPETQGKRLRVEDAFGDKFNVDGLIKDDGVVTGIMLAKLSVQSINKNLKNFRNGIVGELHRYLGNIKNKDNTIYLFNLSPRNTFVLNKNTGKFKNEALPQSFRDNSILEMIAPALVNTGFDKLHNIKEISIKFDTNIDADKSNFCFETFKNQIAKKPIDLTNIETKIINFS